MDHPQNGNGGPPCLELKALSDLPLREEDESSERCSPNMNEDGFDERAGRTWVYPSNVPVRKYQLEISEKALFYNTLVTLPTGLGKTLIAAVVMYNFCRWYPCGKVLFLAPTKPLVSQQKEACRSLMGMPEDSICEMTGSKPPAVRKNEWEEKRMFFLTPQIKCLVVDEAHRATGNHAYCEVIRELLKYGNKFRVLGLSATPGSNTKTVQQVISNLLIAHLEIRTDDSPEIRQHTHGRDVEKIVIPMDEAMLAFSQNYVQVLQGYLSRLCNERLLVARDMKYYSKCLILRERERFRAQHACTPSKKSKIEQWFSICVSLYHGYELMTMHGLKSLYNYLTEKLHGTESSRWLRSELTRLPEFMEVYKSLEDRFNKCAESLPAHAKQCGDQDFDVLLSATLAMAKSSHSKMVKLIEILVEHFRNSQQLGTSTRVIVFSSYRDSVKEIAELLDQLSPLIRPMKFIGQCGGRGSNSGISQKKQMAVIREFQKGGYNTLVSTCVGEEGLDIGEVDLIVCYDCPTSPIRLVQRMGRTGRKRHGKIILLVSEGKEQLMHSHSESSRDIIHKTMKGKLNSFVLYNANPRMIPKGLKPKCLQVAAAVELHAPEDRGGELAKPLPVDKESKTFQPWNGAGTVLVRSLLQRDFPDGLQGSFLIEHSELCKAFVSMVKKWCSKDPQVATESNIHGSSQGNHHSYLTNGCALGSEIERNFEEAFLCISDIRNAGGKHVDGDETDSSFEEEMELLSDLLGKAISAHLGFDVGMASTDHYSSSIHEDGCERIKANLALASPSCSFENIAAPDDSGAIAAARMSVNGTCTDNAPLGVDCSPECVQLPSDTADDKDDRNITLNDSHSSAVGPVNFQSMQHNSIPFDPSKVVFCEEDGELNISNIDLGFDFDQFEDSFDQALQSSAVPVCSKSSSIEESDLLRSPALKKRNSASCSADGECFLAKTADASDPVKQNPVVQSTPEVTVSLRRSRSSYVLSQAAVSFQSDEHISVDESEDSSESIFFDPSFIDQADVADGSPAISTSQMRGVYVRSLNDSPNHLGRRLKLVFSPKLGSIQDTSSDNESEVSTDPCDSFVVPNDFVEFEEQPETIENNFEMLKNARGVEHIGGEDVAKKKRRVLICETSDSDEAEETSGCDVLQSKPPVSRSTSARSPSVTALIDEADSLGRMLSASSSNPKVMLRGSGSVRLDENLQPSSVRKPLVLIGLHQISSAQHIASTFRTSLDVNTHVCSLLDYDYVLSNRMVCKRVFHSEFCNPIANGKIRKSLIYLLSNFSRVVLLLEKDKPKNKFYNKESASLQELQHNKVVDNTLAVLFLEPRMKVVFADSIDDSAAILSQLAKSEARLGYGIQWEPNFNDREMQMLNFYSSFGCTTYVASLNLVKLFGSVEAVMRSDTSDLVSKGRFLRHHAELFYHFIHEQIDPGYL